jgi:hypothetical protein
MRRVALILLSISCMFLRLPAALAADKEKPRFVAGAASSYAGSQTLDKITIAAVPFLSDEQVKSAFGKVDPNRHGVLPVLVVFENGTGKALRLDLKAELITADNRHQEALAPDDVQHLGAATKAPKLPGGPGNPLPMPLPTRVKKGPLNVWEIEGRAFSVKLLPAGESASGFFYFLAEHEPGERLYLTGIREAATGKDFFYFEVPIQKQ